MAKKTIGYVELEWSCPNCGSRNKGSEKICTGCGAAQPADVKFHEPVRQEIIEDESTVQKAKAGPDVHCAFCSARNPAGTTICITCGADLASGTKRETGNVVGAFVTKPASTIPCPNCSTANPDTALKCATCGASLQQPAAPPKPTPPANPPARRVPVWLMVISAVLFIGICALVASLMRTTDETAQVINRQWERSVLIEQFGPVERKDWRDEIPGDGQILTCSQEFRYESSEPVGGAQEVCGTPYTVDEGSGFGQVIQDCTYRVFNDYCTYRIEDWSTLRTISLDGENNTPTWPEGNLTQEMRVGERVESFRILFDVDGKTLAFNTSDLSTYEQATIGSQWNLTVNAMGGIVAIEPSP